MREKENKTRARVVLTAMQCCNDAVGRLHMNEAACKSDASALLGGALVRARGGQSRDAGAWQRRVGASRGSVAGTVM